tara:strand:- start:2260 stop:3330 length:1071 start_codon:yes stop_codon:yes gene_type:complete
MQHTSAGMVVSVKKVRQRTPSQPSFWPTLRGEDNTCGNGLLYLTLNNGYVILRKQSGTDAVDTFLPTGMPDNLLVAVGDKITCKIIEDDLGVFTTAAIIQTVGAWPESTAPELRGGDNATGTDGVRHVRLCEIISTDGIVSVNIINTGDIDHFQPTLIENTSTSSPTTGGRVMKEFEPTSGKWEMRTVECDDGTVTFTEEADRIVVTANDSSSHPWKVTGNGDATVDVAAGKLLSFHSETNPGLSNIPSYFQLKEFANYAGGTVSSINAAGFIYASIGLTTNDTIFEADMADGLTIDRVVPDGSITVAFAAALPTTGDVFIVELANVTFAGGVATVSDQIMTHNPTLWSIDIPPEI